LVRKVLPNYNEVLVESVPMSIYTLSCGTFIYIVCGVKSGSIFQWHISHTHFNASCEPNKWKIEHSERVFSTEDETHLPWFLITSFNALPKVVKNTWTTHTEKMSTNTNSSVEEHTDNQILYDFLCPFKNGNEPKPRYMQRLWKEYR